MKKRIIISLLAILPLVAAAQGRFQVSRLVPRLIPAPVSMTVADSCLFLPTALSVDPQFAPKERQLLETALKQYLKIEVADSDKCLIVSKHDKTLGEEQYRIDISLQQIEITSSTPIGSMWGVQTLCQLLAQAGVEQQGATKCLPVLAIDDTPEYGWRGFHIDLSRHFFTKEFVMEFMENMAFYKLNKLHLHLSDDQGWRVEIDRYPLLTSVGGFRTLNDMDSTCLRKSKYNADMKIDKRFMPTDSTYGGYYTKQDIRDIISRGKTLGIEIIPEIDMPGHLSAAIRAYPYLSCLNKAGWGKEFSAPMCTANPQSIEFARAILDEIADLFPSKYIHIGADEVEKDYWKACPKCRALMKKKAMKSEDELQALFVRQMTDYLTAKGKQTIVWDDAYHPQVPQNLTYMYWRDWKSETPQSILQDGFPLIFASWDFFYLSSYTNDRHLRGLYEFTPSVKYHITRPERLAGYQACLWTEEIPNESRFEYHVYPALQAFSELSWGTSGEYSQFRQRLELHLRLMDKKSITYRVPLKITE